LILGHQAIPRDAASCMGVQLIRSTYYVCIWQLRLGRHPRCRMQLEKECRPDARLRCVLSIDSRGNARSKKDFHSTIRAKPIYFGSGILNWSDPRPFPWKDVLHATPMYSGCGTSRGLMEAATAVTEYDCAGNYAPSIRRLLADKMCFVHDEWTLLFPCCA